MLIPFFPELVTSTDLLSFEHPSVLQFCFLSLQQLRYEHENVTFTKLKLETFTKFYIRYQQVIMQLTYLRCPQWLSPSKNVGYIILKNALSDNMITSNLCTCILKHIHVQTNPITQWVSEYRSFCLCWASVSHKHILVDFKCIFFAHCVCLSTIVCLLPINVWTIG